MKREIGDKELRVTLGYLGLSWESPQRETVRRMLAVGGTLDLIRENLNRK